MKKTANKNTKDGITTALAAVALQDHIIRSLSLNTPNRAQTSSVWKHKRVSASQHSRNRKDGQHSVEKEYVLDSKPPPLTLAQRYGLVEAPKQLLTEDEWKKVKEKAKQRQDFRQPCVICKEELGSQQHVLLSCTHVFHQNCLQSFERYTGRKSCPMCRKEQYQTRVVHDGVFHLREKSATIIQAAWRGYVVKCWYKSLRRSVPPKDPKLRTKFYEEKLKTITDRMVKSIDHDVNSFLREMDRSLEASRDVFRQFDDAIRIIPESEWVLIEAKAKQRAEVDCPICLMSLYGVTDCSLQHSPTHNRLSSLPTKLQPNVGANSKATLVKRQRQVSLLSCSHAFHATCLQALEQFCSEEKHGLTCPVCRAVYQKKLLTAQSSSPSD